MVIDCHTHWMPPPNDQARHDPSHWLAPLREHKIQAAVVLPTQSLLDDGRIEQNHDDLLQLAKQSDGAMIPFCTCGTWFKNEAVRVIESCLKKGFRGIKFHPWLQGASVFSPAMDAVCELAVKYDVPILFHDGTPPFSLPAQIGLLAQRHPRTTLILGHCGLLEYWREAEVVLNTTQNVWGCLCSPHPAAIRHLVKHCDIDRLIWGSDYGFGPSGALTYRLEMMYDLNLSDAQLKKVLEQNPRRLLKL